VFCPGQTHLTFHIPGNGQALEEFLTAKKKPNKFPYKASFFLPSSTFSTRGDFFFKTCCFKGNFDAEKSQ
jgi:hypothetical protein